MGLTSILQARAYHNTDFMCSASYTCIFQSPCHLMHCFGASRQKLG